MENVTHALFLAFAMFSLVLGLSYGIHLISSMNSVASKLIQSNDATSTYQSVSYTTPEDKKESYTRFVGVDTLISTLYRYKKESFSVEIYAKNTTIPYQIFDLTVENVLASGNVNDKEYKAYNKLYGNGGIIGGTPEVCDLFGAPWIVNDEYTKQRVDMFIAGIDAYINGVEVKYSEKGLPKLLEKGNIFEEQFIQYTYEGQTISDNLGEDIESITGSIRAKNKIIIRYIQK